MGEVAKKAKKIGGEFKMTKKQGFTIGILTGLIIGGVLIKTWDAGRAYEKKQASQLIIDNLKAEYIDYTVPEVGKPSVQVNCILDKGINAVFSYTGIDF